MNKSVVTGILVKKNDQVLLVKKPDGIGPYAGTFLTPGGGVNTGEAVDKAVLRELYEETGVKIINLLRVSFDDAVTLNWQGEETHYIMLFYTADYVSGDLQPTLGDDDNLEIIKWFTKAELKTVPLSPPLEKFLKIIGYDV